VKCTSCGESLSYRASIAAPGFGQSWECPNGHVRIKLGESFIDPHEIPHDEEPPWVMHPEQTQ